MRLKAHTDYALRMLIYLALAGDRRSTIGDIARAYDISEHHLMKVSQHLVRCGWVNSVRGKGGGLTLARRPEDVVIGNVVRDMEASFPMAECFGNDGCCVITPFCRLRGLFELALAAFMRELDGQTLAGLLDPSARQGLGRRLFAD